MQPAGVAICEGAQLGIGGSGGAVVDVIGGTGGLLGVDVEAVGFGGVTFGLSTQREVPPVVFSSFPGGQMHLAVFGSAEPPGPHTKFSAAGESAALIATRSGTTTKAS